MSQAYNVAMHMQQLFPCLTLKTRAAGGESVTGGGCSPFVHGGAGWPDQVWLNVELVLLLSYMVAITIDHAEEGRSCWLSAGGW